MIISDEIFVYVCILQLIWFSIWSSSQKIDHI